MTLIEKTIYIYGGHNSDMVFNDIYTLNKITLVWEKVKINGYIPPAFTGIAGARVGKKIYISGGCDIPSNKCNSDTFVFDTDNSSW